MRIRRKSGLVFLLKTKVAAAVFLVLIGITAYIFFSRPGNDGKSAQSKQQEQFKNDVTPGGNAAVLTLSDGSKVVLDSVANGIIANNGAAKISKSDGQVVYHDDQSTAGAITFNKMETPRRGQYALVLSDGTKVWLNAASSIRYPTTFRGNERKVEISGEAYFEVVKNPAAPFKITVYNDYEIEVLGTSLNVNAYADEPGIKTTLVEGLARVRADTSYLVLKPGQQSVLLESKKNVLNGDADIAENIAWKNGVFQFNKSELKTIMRQLARWYDVEVEYKDEIPDRFVAHISRDKPLSKVLNLLELTGLVRFKIEGRKVIVEN